MTSHGKSVDLLCDNSLILENYDKYVVKTLWKVIRNTKKSIPNSGMAGQCFQCNVKN